jgi:AbrB family looped-hinge helix DNA binding protein
MPSATVTSKGQITLPKVIRDLLRLDKGDRVDFVVQDDGRASPRDVDVRELKGLLHRKGLKGRGTHVIGLDTNVLLRYLLEDEAAQAARAERELERDERFLVAFSDCGSPAARPGRAASRPGTQRRCPAFPVRGILHPEPVRKPDPVNPRRGSP